MAHKMRLPASGNGISCSSAGYAKQLISFGEVRRAWRAWCRGPNSANVISLIVDPALLVLGLRQTCFEGSMYIFVFLWVPSMQEASPPGAQLPLGYIFSAFMVSMMIGSVVYTSVVSHSLPRSDAPLVLHAKLASLNCLVASLALACSFSTSLPQSRFWSFCLFEACVGVYYPVQGMLKGSMISNDHRATVSWAMPGLFVARCC